MPDNIGGKEKPLNSTVVSKVQPSLGWHPTPAPTKQAGFKLPSSLLYRPIGGILSYIEKRIAP